jgi:hypothetical protein
METAAKLDENIIINQAKHFLNSLFSSLNCLSKYKIDGIKNVIKFYVVDPIKQLNINIGGLAIANRNAQKYTPIVTYNENY